MSGHVLLVEDEPNIREAMRFLLGRAGWEVGVHADGATAAARIHETGPDVVVLDVMLPGRSGYDVLRDLRAEGGGGPPVLMLTARGQARDRDLAEELGATRFMTKPFANEEFVAAVAALRGAPRA